jgi:hypothetical protein
VASMQEIIESVVDKDGMMASAHRGAESATPQPLSADDLIRLQPLNPYKRLEFSPVSFRVMATIDI